MKINNQHKVKSLKHAYIHKEARANFKDWTAIGLTFLLNDSTLSQDIQMQIHHKLDSLRTAES